MSNNSGKSSANHSSSGSAAELIRGVEQLVLNSLPRLTATKNKKTSKS